MSYINTLITVSSDCPAKVSERPISIRDKQPIHVIQYESLISKPYFYDHENLTFEVYLIREGLKLISQTEKQEIWNKLFTKGHPCLRASSLTKRYGFGAHYNENKKIAIYPIESAKYCELLNNPIIKKIAAMKLKR